MNVFNLIYNNYGCSDVETEPFGPSKFVVPSLVLVGIITNLYRFFRYKTYSDIITATCISLGAFLFVAEVSSARHEVPTAKGDILFLL